jgi:DNA-binding CsgD family transcriptional regulator
MPASDPAYAILAAVLALVPASCWTFARLDAKGSLESLYGSYRNGKGLDGLADELRRQRVKAPTGPRIAATLGSLEEFASGVTLIFADARASYGILTLLRMAEFESFTSSEISVLTFALDAVSERLSHLRSHAAESPAGARAPETIAGSDAFGAFYVLDSDLHIVLAPGGEKTALALRLPVLLERTVRELTDAWAGDAAKAAGVAHPVPFLVVRTQPMSGPAGLFIGVRIERFRAPNSLTGAAGRYHISPREVQVLALLLDGNHLDQIAEQLHITSSTVQDHIKSMLDKTESRNRSELIARVLGWESIPKAPQT